MPTTGAAFTVEGYELRADRGYDPDTHFWVEPRGPERACIGFDPLGRETCGDVVELSFEPPETRVRRGGLFGTVEAAKYVGPLLSPVTGVIVAVNEELVANPGLVNEDPGLHWLVELAEISETERLLRGEERVSGWFAGELRRFRTQGAIAE